MAYCRILLTDPTNTNVLLKLGRLYKPVYSTSVKKAVISYCG